MTTPNMPQCSFKTDDWYFKQLGRTRSTNSLCMRDVCTPPLLLDLAHNESISLMRPTHCVSTSLDCRVWRKQTYFYLIVCTHNEHIQSSALVILSLLLVLTMATVCVCVYHNVNQCYRLYLTSSHIIPPVYDNSEHIHMLHQSKTKPVDNESVPRLPNFAGVG